MESFALVIFGITSNLAQIKLIPALYDMAVKGLLPENMSIIGSSRRSLSKEEIKSYFYQVLTSENKHHKHEIKMEVFHDLVKKVHYVPGDLSDPNFYSLLKKHLETLKKEGISCDNRIYYLATYPDLYKNVFENLKKYGLNDQKKGWIRLMIEKPIGNDLPSAKKLNSLLNKYFSEKQIYRLDHYLGKETLQNILNFRFGNGSFEPLISKEYIDHIQITAAEDFGIGKRGGYFDKVGALKDVGQNHQLQMLAFATMDAPSNYNTKEIASKRIEILRNLVPNTKKVVFGQYEGYLKEENVAENSQTDTFYAFKTQIKNERFKGVPIYVRAGKKLEQTVTEISIVFKVPDNRLFKHLESGNEPNVLIYRIQPNEGIVLRILTKKVGHEMELESSYMQYCYPQDPTFHSLPDPYERLITDALRGDQTFFNHAEEVEAQWKFIDPLAKRRRKTVIYTPGTWGPKEADDLIEKDGRKWLEPSPQFCNF